MTFIYRANTPDECNCLSPLVTADMDLVRDNLILSGVVVLAILSCLVVGK